GEAVEGDGPTDQELADVVQGDGELLAVVVLDDDPAGGDVDHLAPRPLGREVGQPHGLADDLIEDHRGLAGDRVDHLAMPLAEHPEGGDRETRPAQDDQTQPEPARSAHQTPPDSRRLAMRPGTRGDRTVPTTRSPTAGPAERIGRGRFATLRPLSGSILLPYRGDAPRHNVARSRFHRPERLIRPSPVDRRPKGPPPWHGRARMRSDAFPFSDDLCFP